MSAYMFGYVAASLLIPGGIVVLQLLSLDDPVFVGFVL